MLTAYEWIPYEVGDENNITIANAQTFVILVTNRCSFLQTLLIQPPLLLISYYFGLKSEVKYMIDPESGVKFDSYQQSEYVNGRMIIAIGLVILFIINHYFNQLEVASLVIQNEKTERQNTQLKEFFEESDDAVVIVSDKPTQPQIILCNSVAKKYMQQNPDEDLLDKKCFKLDPSNDPNTNLGIEPSSKSNLLSIRDIQDQLDLFANQNRIVEQ